MHVLSHMLSVAWIRATSQRRSTSEDAHAYMLPQHNPTCIFILPDVSVNIWVARSKKYCGGEMLVHKTAELPFSIGSTGSKQQGKKSLLGFPFLSKASSTYWCEFSGKSDEISIDSASDRTPSFPSSAIVAGCDADEDLIWHQLWQCLQTGKKKNHFGAQFLF